MCVYYGEINFTCQQKGENIFMIGERLKQERERLGLTQQGCADITKTSKRSVINWENGETSPTAVQLSSLSEYGFDVLFILTGKHNYQIDEPKPGYSADNPRANALLDNYLHIEDEEDKRAIERLALRSAEAATGKTQSGKSKKIS